MLVFSIFPFVLALVLSPLLSGSVYMDVASHSFSVYSSSQESNQTAPRTLSPNLQLPGKGAIGPDCSRCLISHYNHVDWWGKAVPQKEGAGSKTCICSPQETILRKQRIAFSCDMSSRSFTIKFKQNFLCSLLAFLVS